MAMPLYALLPACNEFFIERGWTLVYSRISDYGLARHILNFWVYMVCVEYFVYWAHRLLHDIKWGYRWVCQVWAGKPVLVCETGRTGTSSCTVCPKTPVPQGAHACHRWLHYIHHKYNKEHTLSPFAGLAFNPIDGILQAIPYTFMLFLTPMHSLTQEIMLFGTGVWTNNIHDNIHGKV